MRITAVLFGVLPWLTLYLLPFLRCVCVCVVTSALPLNMWLMSVTGKVVYVLDGKVTLTHILLFNLLALFCSAETLYRLLFYSTCM